MIGLWALPRPLDPVADRARLVRMFDRLSPATVHRRFFTSVPKLDGWMLTALLSVDHDAHEALVIQVGDELVALASYHRSVADPALADVAVLVEDGWQHHGVGRRLMRSLARLAAERGIERFHADVLADNRGAVGLIRALNRHPRASLDDGTLAFDLPFVRPAA